MQTRCKDVFTAVRTEGSILPADLLRRVLDEDTEIVGFAPADYHLSGERINEAVSRSWNRLQGAWASFRQACEKLPAKEVGTTVVRERWLLPLFQELGYGRLQVAKPIEIEGKTYPISHLWQHAPIHLVSFRVDLDKRSPGVTGASKSSPHSLVQELLNREEGYLWGFVSNGLRLRILRDNKSLTRQAFVEFDLQTMMDGQVYPDFKLLWLLCHQSRVESDRPQQCWLEKWSQTAIKQGTRALDGLRDGVQRAIEALGRGFLSHAANRALRDRLQGGTLDKQDYYRQLLRLIYRLMFLFVAEDRGLLFDPMSGPVARDRYTRFYSTQRLRTLAGTIRGTPHTDLYQSLHLVFAMLDQNGCAELGLPALGSYLWSADAIVDLRDARLANRDLLDAVCELAYANDGQARRPVDYKNLGAEELGSIYESLLELHPQIHTEAGTFTLDTAAGHERKTTGSYYTPTSLVNCLLDSALAPVVNDAIKGSEGYQERGATAADRLLSLKVCDPACGSGHFLIAAAHRIAKRLAGVRSGDEEPAPEVYRHALRDVIGHCIYGVDINPMAVELCKVSLWMEALEPGRPLSFLDHRIQCGNSLIGATPALLARGIPDDVFESIEGDEKALCKTFKKQNKEERKGQTQLAQEYHARPWEQLGNLATSLAQLDALNDETIEGVLLKQKSYEELVKSSAYKTGCLLADAWCAAFVWKKTKEYDFAITEGVFRRIEKNPHDITPWMLDEIQRLARHYQFFHWHLAFSDVFRPRQVDPENDVDIVGWSGGFDTIVGNPPWERVKLQEKEWFAQRRPEIANARNAAERKRLIDALRHQDPLLYEAFLDSSRKAEGESHAARHSGRYPLCGRGDVNTYALFAETNRTLLRRHGRVGCILPSGICTTDTTKHFLQELVESGSLCSFFDFENRKGIFPAVQGNVRFCLLTLAAGGSDSFLVAAQLAAEEQLTDHDRRYELRVADIRRINPNTLTLPTFYSSRDARIVATIYSNSGCFWTEATPAGNPWIATFSTMFHMANDSHRFHTLEELVNADHRIEGNVFKAGMDVLVPLYEAKLAHQYNHRASTFDGIPESDRFKTHPGTNDMTAEALQDAERFPVPRYWVSAKEVPPSIRHHPWLLVFRDAISAVADSRSFVGSIIPGYAVGHTLSLLHVSGGATAHCVVLSAINSFLLDFVLRQKATGAHASYYIVKQLPLFPPTLYSGACSWDASHGLAAWLTSRVLELSYTAWDLSPFGSECGYSGPPFAWEEARRFLIRCELDAAYFSLYSINRDDAEYILESFPIVKRKDIEKHGCYRTKDTILAIYDEMADAIKTGLPYRTKLHPPPGPPVNEDGSFATLPGWEPGQPRPADWPIHIHPPQHVQSGKVRPTDPAVLTTARGTDSELLVRAFLETREKMSSDYVVASPEANARFLARARKLGVGGSDFDINHWLFNARKAGKLRGQPTEIEYRLPEAFEAWVFASEWAGRHLQRQLVTERDKLVALDDILCDPSLAARFDEIAARVKPGFKPIEYRWAAFSQRKRGKAKPAAKTLKVSLNRQMTLSEAMGQAPHGPGLYLIRAGVKPVYLNHTADLNSQIHHHREAAAGQLVPEWLTKGIGLADELTFEHLIGINTDRLREARISSVAELRPWLNLLDLEGAA